MAALREKLKTWKVGDLSVLALFEAARQLGLFDSLAWTDEQHLHALELLMAAYLIAKTALERRKAGEDATS